MVKIKIKPKTVMEVEPVDERQRERERQEDLCDEVRSLRCELEMMKAAMDEMKRNMNEMQSRMQMQMQSRIDVEMSVKNNHAHIHNDGHYEKSVIDLDEWINGLELTLQDLEMMFECKDMIEWASKFIVTDLKQRMIQPHPISVIKGSRNEMIVCDKNVWRKLTDEEFLTRIVNKVFKKLLAVFTAWKNENYNRILKSEQFSTLYHSNYARILSFNENASKLKMKLFHIL